MGSGFIGVGARVRLKGTDNCLIMINNCLHNNITLPYGMVHGGYGVYMYGVVGCGVVWCGDGDV